MAIVNVTPNTTITAWQITGDANIWTVFSDLAEADYTCTVQCTPNQADPSAPIYQILLALTNYPTQQGAVNDWIVFDGTHATIMTPAQFSASYTVA